MLTDQQVDYYRTFGFLILRAHLDERTVADLSEEVDRALRDAFGSSFDERPERGGGITGHYLPAMGSRTPLSRALVEDERLMGVAERLLGTLALPWYAEAIMFFGDAGFHCDDGTGVTGVKFACYLEDLVADNGALRLLPVSHHSYDTIFAWQMRNRAENAEEMHAQINGLPMIVAETRPGDVIAFDLHTFHASILGRDRRQWTISYLKDPQTPEERAAFERHVQAEREWVASAERDYDAAAYPYFDPVWITEHDKGARRERALDRMRSLRVFDEPWQ